MFFGSSEMAVLTVSLLRMYFKFLDKKLGRGRLPIIDKLLFFFEEPATSLDARVAKIEEARRNLIEGLSAIDDLKKEAEQNKAELVSAMVQIQSLQSEKKIAEAELTEIKKIADADTDALRKIVGYPSPPQIWRERFYGFISGVFASIVASGMWWGGGKILDVVVR